MKNQNDLTVVIVTFQTPEKIILDCLRSINKDVKIIIVENSETFSHEEAVNSEFFNVKIICTGKNFLGKFHALLEKTQTSKKCERQKLYNCHIGNYTIFTWLWL